MAIGWCEQAKVAGSLFETLMKVEAGMLQRLWNKVIGLRVARDQSTAKDKPVRRGAASKYILTGTVAGMLLCDGRPKADTVINLYQILIMAIAGFGTYFAYQEMGFDLRWGLFLLPLIAVNLMSKFPARVIVLLVVGAKLFWKHSREELIKAFDEEMDTGGKHVGEGVSFDRNSSRKMSKALKRMREGTALAPYLVIQDVLHRFYSPFRKPENRKRHLRDIPNDVTVSGILYALGTELRSKRVGDEVWYRDYISNHMKQKTVFSEGGDFHLRFRQAAPHLNFPDNRGGTSGELPEMVAISCLKNPSNFPIFVLSIQSIVDSMPEAIASVRGKDPTFGETLEDVCAALQQPVFPKFDNWDRQKLEAGGSASGGGVGIINTPIIKEGPNSTDKRTDWLMAWDPNRIRVRREEMDLKLRRALAVVLAAIDLAAPQAAPVYLKSGDVLLVDNQRALVSRRELDFSRKAALHRVSLLGSNHEWWLRVCYGFRIEKTGRRRNKSR